MAGHQKGINEKFFDKESKAMRYVHGAFISTYIPSGKDGILVRSAHKDIVQIICNQLQSEYPISSDPRGKSSYWFEVNGVPYLRSRLEEMGLDLPKKERRFPENISEDCISDIVRGFIDARGVIRDAYNSEKTNISIRFNHLFLIRLNQTLVKYAEVQHNEPIGNTTVYGGRNSLKIYDLIYQDWDLIKKLGLYLHSKKELFRIDSLFLNDVRKIDASKRINDAKELLLKGEPAWKVAEQVGYIHPVSLSRAFKKETKRTISQWLREKIREIS